MFLGLHLHLTINWTKILGSQSSLHEATHHKPVGGTRPSLWLMSVSFEEEKITFAFVGGRKCIVHENVFNHNYVFFRIAAFKKKFGVQKQALCSNTLAKMPIYSALISL